MESVITAKDVDIIYEIPLVLHKEGLDDIILENLKIWTKEPDFSKWENIVSKIKKLKKEVTIGVVGKYIDLKDKSLLLLDDANKIKRLKKTLAKLIQDEKYESAALVRDKIDKISKS